MNDRRQFGRGRDDDAPTRGGGRFAYTRRRGEDVEKRSEQGAGNFESYLKDSVKMFKPNAGDYLIRILPPPDNTYDHFGIDLFLHYQIGIDRQTYVCPREMHVGECPICEEYARVSKDMPDRDDQTEKEKQYLRDLRASKRVLFYLIDRNAEKEGVHAWPAPWTLDRDLARLMQDKRTGEILFIDDPEGGYDVEFERKGRGLNTEYIGIKIARRSTPLSESSRQHDQWCTFVQDNPLRDVLKIRDYDTIAEAFHATGGKRQGTSGDTDRTESDAPTGGTAPTNFPTWEELRRMSIGDLEDVAEDYKIDIADVSDTELPDYIREWGLESKEPAAEPAGGDRNPRERARELSDRGDRGRTGGGDNSTGRRFE